MSGIVLGPTGLPPAPSSVEKPFLNCSVEELYKRVENDFTLLDKHPELIHLIDSNKKTLLFIACQKDNVTLTEELLKKGAHWNEECASRFTPLNWALSYGNFKCVHAIAKHANICFSDLLENKFLAHVWSIQDETSSRAYVKKDATIVKIIFNTQYEGFNRQVAAARLSEWTTLFLDNDALFDEKILSKADREELKTVLQSAPENLLKTPLELAQRVQKGLSVLLFTGWNEHINAVVFQGKNVFKCERTGTKPVGVEGFVRNDEDLLQTFEKLLADSKTEEGKKTFRTGINDLSKLIKVSEIVQKEQKCGNCGWYSAKAAFLALLYAHLRKKFPDDPVKQHAKTIYKQWSHFVKDRSEQAYLAKVKTPDKNLLSQIKIKKESKKRLG